MKRNLPNLRTAFLCTTFILLTGMGSTLFLGGKSSPQVAENMADHGLEIFAFNMAVPVQNVAR